MQGRRESSRIPHLGAGKKSIRSPRMPSHLTLENTRTTLINGQRVYLVKVARAQRALIYIVCGMLLVNGGGLFALATLGGVGGPTTSWMIIVTAIISLNVAL